MNQIWDVNAGCFGVRKGLMPIRIGGNQAITLHNYPRIRIVGPISLTHSISRRLSRKGTGLKETPCCSLDARSAGPALAPPAANYVLCREYFLRGSYSNSPDDTRVCAASPTHCLSNQSKSGFIVPCRGVSSQPRRWFPKHPKTQSPLFPTTYSATKRNPLASPC